MTTNRIKSTPPRCEPPSTREEAEAVVREITVLKLAEQELKSEMDAEITAIKESYEARLCAVANTITPLVLEIEAWATAHQADFGERKSLELLHGKIGWRITPPALKPLRGQTWASVLELLRARGRTEFIRTTETVNKDALLAARETENLKQYGCRHVQEEEFFVEPKLTTSEPREKA
jgi:phage host-nuclease inhibitor protein Gam